ncbi:hypothetical protein ACLI1A_08340 [Flavobacterium sp. RHBU_3]|uniref:hypothetical protein n=1 Tax=Flavobacterium sp. RHBU_3 TaxID=3391184 RepID=UPI003984E91D
MARRLELSRKFDYRNFVMFNFDFYGVLLYYAYTINQDSAFLLFKATQSEYNYKLGYELPIDDSTSDKEVFISIDLFSEVVDFINDLIIPSLENLPYDQDITQIWGVGSSLDTFLQCKGAFFLKFIVDDIQINDYSIGTLIDKYNQISIFIAEAYDDNEKYNVVIE